MNFIKTVIMISNRTDLYYKLKIKKGADSMNLQKKITITAVLLISLISGAYADEVNARTGFSIKAGIDIPGTIEFDYSGSDISEDMQTGFSGTVEYAKGFNDMFSFGGGVSIQSPRGVDDSSFDGEIGFIDGYGQMNYILPVKTGSFNFYTSLQFGLSLPYADRTFKDNLGNDASLSCDMYWGAAAGVLIEKHYIVEAYYKAHHGEVENISGAEEFEYRHFGLSVGYQF